MPDQQEPSFADRLALSFFGGLSGMLYGACIAGILLYATGRWHSSILAWSFAIFALLGYFFGNFVIDAFSAFLHFLWGIVHGFYGDLHPNDDDYNTRDQRHLRNFMLLGIGTGLVLWLWYKFG